MSKQEINEARLSAYLDGELTQQDSQHVEVCLRRDAALRRQLEELTRVREQVGMLDRPVPSGDEWSAVMANVTSRATRGVGWLLWIGGAVVLVAYGIYEFLTDPTVEAIERICVLAILLGAFLVFMTVVFERIRTSASDKYKDVEK
jgi:anti-sigma factor RsiW